MKPQLSSQRPVCRHRGLPTGQLIPCGPMKKCRQREYHCAVHGTCTMAPAEGVQHTCAACPDYAPAAPGQPSAGQVVPGVRPDWHASATPDRCCLVTLNLGGVLHPHARASLQFAAGRWGVEYREITEPFKPDLRYPTWNKVFLGEWARQQAYTRCAYVDADILIRSDCPNLFAMVPPATIGVVTNDVFPGSSWFPATWNVHASTLTQWAAQLHAAVPPIHKHVNSGLLVWTVEHHGALWGLWRRAAELVSWAKLGRTVDQAALSVVLSHLYAEAEITWLPAQYNCQVFRPDLLRTDGPMQAYVYHFSGTAAKARLPAAQWDVRRSPAPAPAPAPAPLPAREPAPPFGPDYELGQLVQSVRYINLARRSDRAAELVRSLPDPWPFPSPELLVGIDHRDVPAPAWWAHPPGQWGCRLSHLRCLEWALRMGQESVLVMEDDCEFRPDALERLRRFVAALPRDWEVIHLGGQQIGGRVVRVNDEVCRPGRLVLAHCYALRGNGLKLAYQHAHEHTPDRAEFDQRLGDLVASGRVQAYAPWEWIAWQRAGYSDLREQLRPQRGTDDLRWKAEVQHA